MIASFTPSRRAGSNVRPARSVIPINSIPAADDIDGRSVVVPVAGVAGRAGNVIDPGALPDSGSAVVALTSAMPGRRRRAASRRSWNSMASSGLRKRRGPMATVKVSTLSGRKPGSAASNRSKLRTTSPPAESSTSEMAICATSIVRRSGVTLAAPRSEPVATRDPSDTRVAHSAGPIAARRPSSPPVATTIAATRPSSTRYRGGEGWSGQASPAAAYPTHRRSRR